MERVHAGSATRSVYDSRLRIGRAQQRLIWSVMRLVRQSVTKSEDLIGHAKPPLLAEAPVNDRVATPVAISLISMRNWRHTPALPRDDDPL